MHLATRLELTFFIDLLPIPFAKSKGVRGIRTASPIVVNELQGKVGYEEAFCAFHAESGATAIEYGLIAAGISVAIITVVGTLGSGLKTTFTSVQTAIK